MKIQTLQFLLVLTLGFGLGHVHAASFNSVAQSGNLIAAGLAVSEGQTPAANTAKCPKKNPTAATPADTANATPPTPAVVAPKSGDAVAPVAPVSDWRSFLPGSLK